MDLSSIGAVSIDMHLAQTQQSVSVAMLKKAMDTTTAQSEQMIDSLRNTIPAPLFGHLLDTYA